MFDKHIVNIFERIRRGFNNRSSTDEVLEFLIFSLLSHTGLTIHGDSFLDLGHLFNQGPYYNVL